MSVTIIKQGLLDTIQDEGRYGYQHLGINPTGAMDLIASSVANMLVGNQRSEPVIELHFPASTFRFNKACIIALSGGDFQPTVNDLPVAINTSLFVPTGAILKFTRNNKGSRCYFAVKGGWNVDKWLHSCSTNLKAKVGGYKGRALRKDDELGFRNTGSASATDVLTIQVNVDILDNTSGIVRCVKGSEYDFLTDESKRMLESKAFQISLQSDRMGYRLEGDDLEFNQKESLLSSAVTRGTIQLLPSGQLIILMADHQTTGGYPKVAHVISADFPVVAQKRTNEELRFRLITNAEAEEAFIQQQRHLQQLEQDMRLQLSKPLHNDFN